MIRTKGAMLHRRVVHAVKHIRQIVQEMKILTVLGEENFTPKPKRHQVTLRIGEMVEKKGSCRCRISPLVEFATPADASLVMQLGPQKPMFVGSGIFMKDPLLSLLLRKLRNAHGHREKRPRTSTILIIT